MRSTETVIVKMNGTKGKETEGCEKTGVIEGVGCSGVDRDGT